ncbi:MAG: hypothetical protein N3A38_13715 [Planctomycetota bacterium]|nr:hypothetical protein [Planctomycetota bacterium]
MSSGESDEFVVACVACDEIEARALVVFLRDKGIPASAERRQASSTFVSSGSQTSILTRRGDVARARALVESLSIEERERMRRAMAETVFMALDQCQIEEIIRAERLAAARRGAPPPDAPSGDKAMIFQGISAAEASRVAEHLRARGVPAVVVGGSDVSPGVLPAVYVSVEQTGEARDILREFMESERRSGAAGAGEARELPEPEDAPDAGPVRARGGRSPAALASRVVAMACGAALLGYAASSAPDPVLTAGILAVGAPMLFLLARLCLTGRTPPARERAMADTYGAEGDGRPGGGDGG